MRNDLAVYASQPVIDSTQIASDVAAGISPADMMDMVPIQSLNVDPGACSAASLSMT
jgi:hypothetical protein